MYLSNYDSEYNSASKKYYYRISNYSYYNYSIVSYGGEYPEGSLLFTNDYKNYSYSGSDSKGFNREILQNIILISFGIIIFLVLIFILICCCCKRCRKKNKIDSIPSNSAANPLNQSANNPGIEIPLQTVSDQA